MHIFYKDKSSLFEFKINVEGAELENTFARVIIENNNRKYLFEGKIQDGLCSIDLPALKEFKEIKEGKLSVEVVADNSYFVPYEGVYELKESKKVVIEMITKKETITKPKVIVEAIQTKEEIKNIQPIKEKRNFEKEFIVLFEKHKKDIIINKTSLMSSKEAIDISKFLKEKKLIRLEDEIKFQNFIDTKISSKQLSNIKKALGFDKQKV